MKEAAEQFQERKRRREEEKKEEERRQQRRAVDAAAKQAAAAPAARQVTEPVAAAPVEQPRTAAPAAVVPTLPRADETVAWEALARRRGRAGFQTACARQFYHKQWRWQRQRSPWRGLVRSGAAKCVHVE